MTPTKLAKMVGAIPPYANPTLDAARQLLAANPDGRPTLAQITDPTIQRAITIITIYQDGCERIGAKLAAIPPNPSNARLIEFGL